MKGSVLATNWRTIQFFLDDYGVYEVEADPANYRSMRCSCNDFSQMSRCSHVKFVRTEIDRSGGVYALKINGDIPDEEVEKAMADGALFRLFIMKHTKPLVIK